MVKGVITSVLLLFCASSVWGLPPEFAERYAEVQECTGLTAKAPKLRLKATTECPTSGVRCCLRGVKPFPCSWDTAEQCGVAGRYKKNTIILPDECTLAFEHEAIHHLKKKNGLGVDREHLGPEWACE